MTRVHIEPDYDGIVDLLSSAEVDSMLRGKADAVAAAARSQGVAVDGTPGSIPLPIEVVDAGSSSRSRFLVVSDHAAGLAVEAKHRLLVTSLDAARSA